MKTVYLDSDFKCHVTDDGTMTALETDLFAGKCDAYIEGYRFIPAGETWADEYGMVFKGESFFPWIDSRVLNAYQEEYEKNMLQIEELKGAVVDAEEAQAAYEEGVQLA